MPFKKLWLVIVEGKLICLKFLEIYQVVNKKGNTPGDNSGKKNDFSGTTIKIEGNTPENKEKKCC